MIKSFDELHERHDDDFLMVDCPIGQAGIVLSCKNIIFMKEARLAIVEVNGYLVAFDSLYVIGDVNIKGDAIIKKSLTVLGDIYVEKSLTVLGDMLVMSSATISENLFVGGNLTVAKDLTVNGNVFFAAKGAIVFGTRSIKGLVLDNLFAEAK